MKGLPLAYDKDMQEDKEGVFDAASTRWPTACAPSTAWCARCASTPSACAPARTAASWPRPTWPTTSSARGMPFREAHEIVGRLVLVCEKSGHDAPGPRRSTTCGPQPPLSATDALAAVDIDEVVRRRTSEGGTGHEAVRAQLAAARAPARRRHGVARGAVEG